MPRHWFDKISQYFHANNRGVMSINAQRKPVDKLYLVRPVLGAILRQIEDNYCHIEISGRRSYDSLQKAFKFQTISSSKAYKIRCQGLEDS